MTADEMLVNIIFIGHVVDLYFLQHFEDRYAVGQNVATTWSYQRMPPIKDKPEFERHIMGWFDEVHKYHWKPRDIEPFNFRMDTGHYTQVSPKYLTTYFHCHEAIVACLGGHLHGRMWLHVLR